MKNGLWLIGLVIGFLSCSKPADDLGIDTTILDSSKNVTALLNDSTWYGKGNANKLIPVSNDACTVNKFNLYISNELPYPKGVRRITNDCIGPCNTTQMLSFTKIPLVIGRYDVTTLNSCSPFLSSAVTYGLLVGGDAVFSAYNSAGTDSGWIEVTRADTVAKVVEGTFELNLVSQDKMRTIAFRKGHFLTRLLP